MDDFADDPEEIVAIVNPTSDDFDYGVVDIHDKERNKISYTIKARESLKLPRYAANIVSEHLAQLMESRKSGVITKEYHQKILEQIRMYSYEE